MGILLNHPCMCHEDFEIFKQELEAVKSSAHYKHVHHGEKDYWVWPALILTLVEFSRDLNGIDCIVNYTHTSVSQKRLLKVLGLSQEEIKVEFNALPIELTPESFENREV